MTAAVYQWSTDSLLSLLIHAADYRKNNYLKLPYVPPDYGHSTQWLCEHQTCQDVFR